MKADYTEFDKALIEGIQNGNSTLTMLDNTKIRDLARPFCSNLTPPWCIIDRRLQAMRKKGLIQFTSKMWVVLAMVQS